MKKKVKEWLIHRLGGYTEGELEVQKTREFRAGRTWMYHQVYHWCRGLEGKTAKKAWPIFIQWMNEKYKLYYR